MFDMVVKYLSKISTNQFTEKLAGISLILAMFCMLFSMQTMNKFLALSMFFMLVQKNYRQKLVLIFSDHVVIATSLLVLLLSIGILYSAGSIYEAYRVWDKYLKILYLIIFLPLFFVENQKWKRNLIYVLIAATCVNELITYLHFFKLVSFAMPETKHWLFVQDIDASFILAFMCYLLLNLSCDDRKYRWFYSIVLLFCFYDLFFMNQERTGYLVFVALLLLFLWQRLQFKKFIIASLLVPIFLAMLYQYSSPFNSRIKQIAHDIHSYQAGDQFTSIGYRIIFAKYSFSVIKQHLLIGAGTGSFIKLYTDMHGPKLTGNTTPGHPHNEYIFVWFQLGLLGLGLFLYWFFVMYKKISILIVPEQHLAKGLWLAFMVLGCCNCSLYVSPAGVFFVIVMSAFLAEPIMRNTMVSSQKNKILEMS